MPRKEQTFPKEETEGNHVGTRPVNKRCKAYNTLYNKIANLNERQGKLNVKGIYQLKFVT